MGIDFRKVKIGFANLALDFLEEEDLKAASNYAKNARDYLKKELGVELVDYDKPLMSCSDSREAWKHFKSNMVDAVVIFNGTFSTGDVTVEIVRNLDCPFLVWGIEEFAIKKHNFTGSMVGVLPAGPIFKNLGKKFTFVYGNIERENTQKKVKVFVDATRAIAYLKEASIGVIGMRPDGFEISGFDELAVKKVFGTTIKKISMYGFSSLVKSISEEEIDEDMKNQEILFDIKKDDKKESRGLSRIYLALKKVIKENNLQSYAPDCWPEFRDDDKTPLCPANGRLNDEGIMASCEADVDGSLTMMAQYAMTGKTPWFADFVNIIEENDTLLFWHGGNAAPSLSSKKPQIERVFGGLSQTMSLKSGTVTICRINHFQGNFSIHAGVGEAVEAEPALKGSNMSVRMRNGNMKFIESLLENGIPHHNAIIYGDITEELKEFAQFLDIPIVIQ